MTSRRSGMDVPVILDTEGQGDGAGMYVRGRGLGSLECLTHRWTWVPFSALNPTYSVLYAD